jgi:hypothetical protein
MGIDVGEDSIWMTRSDQSPDPLDGQVCCSAIPSANSQLLETYDLIEKSDVLDSIDDDDDIEWPENPFDYREDQNTETTEELLAMIRFEGSVGFQAKLRKLCEEYIDVFSTRVRHQSAKVEPMSIVVDRGKWEVSRNRLPPRHHNSDKQTAIREQVDALLRLGVIEVSHAPAWSQVHLVPKPDGKWRFTLDFVQLNACTGALEGWPIPNISDTLKRIGDAKPKVFGLIDFTAGYHQTPLDKDSRVFTAFICAFGLFQWTRVAMGLKGSGPYFQRSMASVVLAGLVYIICEIYIDDVLIHGRSEEDFLVNLRKVLDRLRTFNVAANPKKTKLGLSEVEYVGHVVSSEGTSFTDEKRLKVLDFPLPETHRGLLMFIGLANYFRDHVPNITEMLKPLRDMILVAKGANLSKKLIWTEERIAAFKECQIAVSNCQQLYFLDDTTTPILQTDASDYGVGAYFYEIRDGKIRVIRFLSKSLTGAQLNWSTIEKECYGLYWAVKMLEEYLDNRRFILKTDHKNLTYINKTPKGKVLRWKLFLQGFDFLLYHIPGKEIHQAIPDALSRLCTNLIEVVTLSAIDNKERIPGNLYRKISAVHNSEVGHMGLQVTKDRLNDATISDRWIKLFIKQCP